MDSHDRLDIELQARRQDVTNVTNGKIANRKWEQSRYGTAVYCGGSFLAGVSWLKIHTHLPLRSTHVAEA